MIRSFRLLTTSLILDSISSEEYFLCVDVPLRSSISQYCANNSGQRDSARVVRVALEKENVINSYQTYFQNLILPSSGTRWHIKLKD